MKSQYRMFFAFVALLLIVSLACNFGAAPTPNCPLLKRRLLTFRLNNLRNLSKLTNLLLSLLSRLFRPLMPWTFIPRNLMAISAIGPTLPARMM